MEDARRGRQAAQGHGRAAGRGEQASAVVGRQVGRHALREVEAEARQIVAPRRQVGLRRQCRALQQQHAAAIGGRQGARRRLCRQRTRHGGRRFAPAGQRYCRRQGEQQGKGMAALRQGHGG